MANEIGYRDPSGTTGLTIYAFRFTPTGAVWNGTSHVAFNSANWSSYAIALTGAGGGWYFADMPAAAAGAYYVTVYKQAGGSPAATDASAGTSIEPIQWDGTAEVPLASRSTYSGGAVASVSAPVTVGTNNDKTGYSLAATGLDAISVADPGGVAGMTTFPKMMVAVWRYLFKKSTMTSTQMKTYADDGTTVNATQALSDDGTTQTKGAAS